jgi:hypothetical protein
MARVTLVTGDQVTVSNTGAVSITPAADRGSVRFTSFRQSNGHLYVLPTDAADLVATGRLDLRLFDVSALAASGYDTARGSLPLIITRGARDRAATRAAIDGAGGSITRELTSVSGFAVRSRHARATSFWNRVTAGSARRRTLEPEFGAVWLDGRLGFDLDQSVGQVRAPQAWAAGYDGTGVTVAVLDSGIDTTHPDLTGKVVAARNFTTEPDAADLFGHGTHIASTVAGSGAASGGAYRGVAPGAMLINAKVCTVPPLRGDSCQESAVLDGMEWAAEQGADVVNISLSEPDEPGADPVETAINNLTVSEDVLFVVSAGNQGERGSFTVGYPGSADLALTVGAVDGSDALADFSSRGPRVGDAALKPDITAPGVAVTAARSSTGVLGEPGQSYLDADGTSMAAPHVAAAAAIMAQARPDWSALQIKNALIGAVDPNPALTPFEQGAGRLNIERALNQTVTPTNPGISLDRQNWPHSDNPVMRRPAGYRNHGTSPITLDLTVTTRGPDGSPAPAGMFQLDTERLTLGAGASGDVTLTAATADHAPGFYSGTITATAPGIRVTTPFGVDLRPEGWTLTLNHLDRDGAETSRYVTTVYPLTPGAPMRTVTNRAGPVELYLEPDAYMVVTSIYGDDAAGMWLAYMVNPRVDMTQPQSITFDARTAGQVDPRINDDPLERLIAVEVGFELVDGDRSVVVSNVNGLATSGPPQRIYVGQDQGNGYAPGFTGKVETALARPGPQEFTLNSPRVYHLASFFGQHMPSGWAPAYATGGLARVNATLATDAPGATVFKGAHAYPGTGRYGLSSQFTTAFNPPFPLTEYYNTGSNLRWQGFLTQQVTDGPVSDLESGLADYRAGTTVSEVWNKPVIGPAHGMAADPSRWAVRLGDLISTDIQLFGDSAGHPGRVWSYLTGQQVLRRDGVVLGEAPYPADRQSFPVPGGYGTYELTVSADRAAPIELSTHVDAVWTFKSDTIAGSSPVRLPLWNVSFRPTLNAGNSAPAGRSFSLPAVVTTQPNSTAAALRTVSVQYSTNDGATWKNAVVTGSGTNRTVTVVHPPGNGFVSLRATVTDQAGNGVVQTIIRAYKTAP